MGAITVSSAAFKNGQQIPVQYTGEGPDISPQISWNKITGAQSYALICDDPDAPKAEPWVHWVIFNIPPAVSELPENVVKAGAPQNVAGAIQGKNDSAKAGYHGPMPPRGHGVHHYHFKIYALDTMLTLKEGATKSDLEKAMKGHILVQGELVGTYERK